MNAIIRYLFLVPLGLLFGITTTLVTFLILTIFVPDLAQTIGAAIVAATNAVFDSLTRDDTAGAAAVGMRAWQLLAMTFAAPVVITAVLGEMFRLGGALGHAVVSGVLAALVPLAASGAASRVAEGASGSGAESRVLACLFFAGAAGGLLYFLIGGRRGDATPQLMPPGNGLR
ncbi:MAG: hypothetical protein ACRCTD_03250 [Beijerinckiaceae bacterium]